MTMPLPELKEKHVQILDLYLREHHPEACADWVITTSKRLDLVAPDKTLAVQTSRENVAYGFLLGLLFAKLVHNISEIDQDEPGQ